MLSGLTEFISDPSDTNALHQFIVSYNLASGYVDNDVINACHEFLSSMEVSDDKWDKQKTNDAINHIFKAVRKDINPKAPYSNFVVFNIPKRS